MNAKIILIVAAMAASSLAFAQDTTNVPVIEGDPQCDQSPETRAKHASGHGEDPSASGPGGGIESCSGK